MKIAVSKGHNVYHRVGNRYVFDPGATNSPYVEADINNKTVEKLIPMLRAKGHQVMDVTPLNQRFNSQKASHEARSKKINAWKPDLYLDVHINAGGGTGSECLVYSTTSKAYPYARKITNAIAKNTGLSNRGVKVRPGFWSLSLHTAPSIIVEGGFIDSPNGQDMKKLTPAVYAKSIADAFDNIKRPEEVKPVEKIVYRVRKDWADPSTQNGAYSELGNAIAQAKKLGNDYKVFDKVGKQMYPDLNRSPYDVHFDNLNKKGITVHEKRYNDNITRGEMMALLDRATDAKK